MGKPIVVRQVFTGYGELIRWLVILADGATAFLTTTEVMELARQAA